MIVTFLFLTLATLKLLKWSHHPALGLLYHFHKPGKQIANDPEVIDI